MGTASASAVRADSWRGEGFFSESMEQSYKLQATSYKPLPISCINFPPLKCKS